MIRTAFTCSWLVCTGLLWLASPDRAAADTIDHLFSQFRTQHDAGNYRTSEWLARQMIANADTDGWRAASYISLGRSLNAQGRSTEAIAAFQQAMRYPLQPDNVNRGWAPNNLGIVYFDDGNYAEAERYFQQARAVFESMKGLQSAEVATIYMNLGNCCKNTGRHDEAQQYYDHSLATRRRLFGENSGEVAFVYANLGDLRRRQNRFAEAEEYLRKALEMRRRLQHAENPNVAWTLHHLCQCALDQKQFESAERLAREALALAERVNGKEHYNLKVYLEDLVAACEGRGKSDDAEKLHARLKIIETRKEAAPPPYQPVVEVLSATAYVQRDGRAIATVRQGQRFDVIAVNGPWVGVVVTVGGEKKTGWLRHQDVLAVAPEGLSTELRWAAVRPEGAGASIEFPGSARPGTQTVNGVQHKSYELSVGGLTYVFGYFDLPPGTALSFDAAINAYATARNGTVQGERNVSLDDHAGKEFTVGLPDGSASRMRLMAIGRRWYQLVVEGNATAVAGANADRFMNSFKLAE